MNLPTPVKTPILLLVLALTLTVVLPTSAQDSIPFPPLQGEYAVGRTVRVITDSTRAEQFTPDTSDVRTLPLTIYYPAQPGPDSTNGIYATPAEVDGFVRTMNVPPELINAFLPNYYIDAPAAVLDGGYPVLLFMPGLDAASRLYSSVLEQVASYGYVIVVVDPVYSASVAFFEDGTTVTSVPAALEVNMAESTPPLLNTWVADARFALDSLPALNDSDTLLAGLFDLTRVGMFGHSFGGAASAAAAAQDNRIAAALNMDGTMYGEITETGLSKPFMLIESERASSPSEISDAELAAAGVTREQFLAMSAELEQRPTTVLSASPAGYFLMISGTAHNSFLTDVLMVRSILPEAAPPEFAGTIQTDRAITLTESYITAFFDAHVRGLQTPVLPAQPDPDVVIVARPS